jgi:hypothetical protein
MQYSCLQLLLWTLSIVEGYENYYVSEIGSISVFRWMEYKINSTLLGPSIELFNGLRVAPRRAQQSRFFFVSYLLEEWNRTNF